ncbi:MAG: FG-GAP repeat protein, partial [Myxococcota bacterium]|nr:FG-GAP repeat protein [Myxococcota bacterium]
EQKLTASDGAEDDNFGMSVALTSDGSRALVGASWDDVDSNMNQGSAYVFVWTGTNWREELKLTASDGAADNLFGASVALTADGSRALVGAPWAEIGPDEEPGSAYVFLSGLTDGEPCTSADECVSGFCVDGRCAPKSSRTRRGSCACRAPGPAPDAGLDLASTLGGAALLGRKRRRR